MDGHRIPDETVRRAGFVVAAISHTGDTYDDQSKVLQRTGELGIRVALGARRGDVLLIVALAADISVGLGIIAGLVLGFSPNRVIARWVENGTGDPLMVLVVSVVMIAVAALACFSPARRRSPS
jgi:ABC-type antimicrobial peptide transport system permease subunit